MVWKVEASHMKEFRGQDGYFACLYAQNSIEYTPNRLPLRQVQFSKRQVQFSFHNHFRPRHHYVLFGRIERRLLARRYGRLFERVVDVFPCHPRIRTTIEACRLPRDF